MSEHSDVCELKEKIARIEERLKALDTANDLARNALSSWQASSNEWRAALNDQRGTFVTHAELKAALAILLAILTLVVPILLNFFN